MPAKKTPSKPQDPVLRADTVTNSPAIPELLPPAAEDVTPEAVRAARQPSRDELRQIALAEGRL